MSTHIDGQKGLVAVIMVMSLLLARHQEADALVAPSGARESTQAPAPLYDFTDLGLPADSVAYGNYGSGADINNNGVIVGSWAWPGASGAPGTWPDKLLHAFKWDRGVLTEVTLPPVILNQEPFLTGCRPTDPATQSASCSITQVHARAIDDVGRIVGTFMVRKTQCQAGTCSDAGGWLRGFVMPDGGDATIIQCPPGSGCNNGFADVWGANVAGVVTGNYTTGDGIQSSYQTHGFRDSTVLDYPGATWTYPRGINGRFDMDVVGYYQQNELSNLPRGFLFTLGEWVPIDVPNSYYTVPSAINDAGEIVGTYADATGGRGFVWPNAPIGTASSISDGTRELAQALGNNDRGQIVGILPPVPPGYQRFVLAQLSTTPVGVAPTITATTANQGVTAGANATFTVAASGTPAPTFQWQVSTNGGTSFSDLSNASPYSGVTSTTLTITAAPVTLNGARYRAVATNSTGSAATSTAVLTVRGAASISPASLRFAAVKAGEAGAMTAVTGAQAVTLTFAGAPSGWTATSNVPWLEVTRGSGSGAGQFTVSIVNPLNEIGGNTLLSADITIAAPTAPAAVVTVPVTLRLILDSAPTASAIGQVDTPAQSSNDVVGAIGVTGWALDDVGVAHVKIYRPCLGIDNPLSCQTILGQSVVFVGDAAFLPGARPDVEAAFPAYPKGNAAGWGMQILTNMLPQIPNSQLYGGQGALTLYVYATDLEGNIRLLGRSSDPLSSDYATPTFITMGNDTIAKPFGTIDTPALGETISGTVANFGWVLTPDSNTTAGEVGDILMTTSGAGMVVYIDGVATSTVAYNQCRGDVGNPPGPGVFCNDDIANIFGNTTPQATLTTRTANPTRFRNLDATRSAIGAYVMNTTTLTNGRHQIAWGVADSATRGEGIGSRFFTVLNSGADAARRSAGCSVLSAECGDEAAPAPAPPFGGRVFRPGVSAGPAEDRAAQPLYGRTGYALNHAWKRMFASEAGTYTVRLPESGRLELWLGEPADAGYLVATGTLRPLPVGSTLSGSYFAWMPPLGYVGPYTLAFVRGTDRLDVTVAVAPVAATPAGTPEVQMFLDPVRVEGPVLSERSVRVEGWTFDPKAAIGSGIGAVHVWAKRTSGPGSLPRRSLDEGGSRAPDGASPIFLGAATLDVARPDVSFGLPGAPSHAGYQLTATLGAGTWELTAYVWNERTARWEDARSVPVIVR